ncbi:MAG: DUF58 domain-containing protein [Phycisphaerae bacterium]|nr:DUF58 domain-containing protein [Phycisphaerae bacterium]
MIRTPNLTRPKSLEDLLDPPLIAKIARLDYTSKKIFAGKLKGERRSKKRGESVEFADHRPYVEGDDLRHIDWNIFGRLDRLFLKLFLEEEDLALHVVMDCSASADCGQPNKFRFMQRLAMALGYIGLVNLNRVTVSAMGGAIGSDEAAGARGGAGEAGLGSDATSPGRSLTPSVLAAVRDLRGRRRTHDLARFLCSLRPAAAVPFTECCRRVALARRGKGVMVVMSDFFIKEGYETGLRLLVGRGYDLFLIQVLSPQELEPDIAGDLRLRDIEDGDQAEVTISAPLLKRYKANLAAYCEQLREFCARREIGLLTVRSDMAIDVLILDYLRKRGILR